MFEMIRKSLLASLGAAVVTKEKVEAATRKWVDEGRISTDEAERLAQDLVENGRKQWEDIQAKVSETVRQTLEGLDIATRKDIDHLSERIDEIERKVPVSDEPGESEERPD